MKLGDLSIELVLKNLKSEINRINTVPKSRSATLTLVSIYNALLEAAKNSQNNKEKDIVK